MKSFRPLLCFTLLASAVAACGSDKDVATSSAAACVAPTDAELQAAGFTGMPTGCDQNMFAKYTDAGFQKVNGLILSNVQAADTNQLGTSFVTHIFDANSTRQTEFGEHLLQFLETGFGSKTAYTGPAMLPAHAPLKISIAQYNYFIQEAVVPALTTAGVTSSDISACFAPVVTNLDFVKTVITCK